MLVLGSESESESEWGSDSESEPDSALEPDLDLDLDLESESESELDSAWVSLPGLKPASASGSERGWASDFALAQNPMSA